MSQSSLAMDRSSDEGIESMMQEDFNVAETLHNVSVFESNRDSFPIITDHINDPNIMEEGNGTMKSIPNQMPTLGLFDIPIKGFNEGVTRINYNYSDLRLCLVRVKYFQENKYFPEMLFLGKKNIFKCLVAFQKMLWKIFSSVWLFC